jgi:poly(A) polymerase
VRDLILGETPADYDVATDATPEQVMAALPYRAVTVGISFGVVRVREPGANGAEVEVATFRSDGAYVDGRRPETVVFTSAEVDATRRDFTINGMFMNPLNLEVIDYVGGQADLRAGVLRAIGDPYARFREDKLRLLRAVRMAARFDFQIEPLTLAAVRAMAGEVTAVSAERIAQELRRALVHERRALAIKLALETGILAAVLPELLPLVGLFEERAIGPREDLWEHTMRVMGLLGDPVSFPLAFAALLHDVGKPVTRVVEDGVARFGDWAGAGAGVANEVGRWLVSEQGVPGGAKRMREAKLKRILAEPGILELLALHRADAMATTGDTEGVDYCEYYLREQPSGPISPPPLLNGNDLKEQGLLPGPYFAKLLREIREAQLDGEIESKEDAIEWAVTRSRAVSGGG